MGRRRLGGTFSAVFALIALLRSSKQAGGQETELTIAYIANIFVLVPVGLSTLFSQRSVETVFENRFQPSDGFRILVGTLWTGLLFASVIGLFFPLQMVGILIFQVLYKSLYLAVYAIPSFVSGNGRAVPRGMTAIFLVIVLLWPVLIWRGLA
ncbi:MAG: hypothetical protein AAF619_08325 [Pseudomonadota bacterium]